MKINDRFSIERDDNNYIVIERKKTRCTLQGKKPKKPFKTTSHYFTKLEQACFWILNKSAYAEDAFSIAGEILVAKSEIIKAINESKSIRKKN